MMTTEQYAQAEQYINRLKGLSGKIEITEELICLLQKPEKLRFKVRNETKTFPIYHRKFVREAIEHSLVLLIEEHTKTLNAFYAL